MIVAVPYRPSLSLLVVVSTLSLFASPAWPHGGGLDTYGCHHNRLHGGYHCHRGPFKGSMFDSKAEMLRALEASAPVAQAGRQDELTIATWNIQWLNAQLHRGRVKRREGDYAALRRYAQALNADVIALQEVDGPIAAARVFPPDEYEYHFSTRRSVTRVGFVIRKGIPWKANPDYAALDVGKVPRGVDITLYPDTQPIRLLAVHLKSGCFRSGPLMGFSKACRTLRRQVPMLERWIDDRAREGVPFFVLGDFNRQFNHDNDAFWAEIDDGEPPNADLTNFTVGHIDECHDRKWPRFIDHIVADRLATELVLKRSFRQIVFTPQDTKAWKLSDHCPISLRVQLG